MGNDSPLVTVIVITYNSSKTVLQTLDSVKNQTYKNIQLVISDDGSKDDTVELCEEWVSENINSLNAIDFLKVSTNTGTPGNCNRACAKSKGEWIKLIAGDDLLLPSCIEDFVCYVSTMNMCDFVCSKFTSFICENGTITRTGSLPKKVFLDKFDSCKTSLDQLYLYIETSANITPALFYKKSLVEEVGGFNERYRIFEDTPFVVEALKHNHKLYYLDKETVLYRKDSPSVTRDLTRQFFFRSTFIDCSIKFRREKIYSLYKWYNLKFWLKEYSFLLLYHFTIKVLKNKRTRKNQIIYNIFKALNPYYLINKVLE